jgi:Ca2+/Na+ antiporter
MEWDWESIAFNSCSLVAGLFVFQNGADLFIDHSALVARRFGVSETLVALLIAGSEWEEVSALIYYGMHSADCFQLAVVVASILQDRSSIGLGNVVGSSISNILGAFSLGLLLFPERVVTFDRSSKIYAGALFLVTSVFTLLAYTSRLDFTGGIFFLVAFAIYLFSMGSAVYEGFLTAPQEDEDEDGDGDAERGDIAEESGQGRGSGLGISIFSATLQVPPFESTPLLAPMEDPSPNRRMTLIDEIRENNTRDGTQYRLTYHLGMFVIGLMALSLSGYVLSHSASTLAADFHLNGTLVGMSILAFATTLPEKLHSTLEGVRGHSGMLVATTAGSNIFLLTLCTGVLFISQGEGEDSIDLGQELLGFEVWTAWTCSMVLVIIVFMGGRRWMGPLLLGCYAAFIGSEFLVFRR